MPRALNTFIRMRGARPYSQSDQTRDLPQYVAFNGEPGPRGLCARPSKCTDLDRPAAPIQSQCYASVFHGPSASGEKATRSCPYISAQKLRCARGNRVTAFCACLQKPNAKLGRYLLRLVFLVPQKFSRTAKMRLIALQQMST
jgi:hypothetical protein